MLNKSNRLSVWLAVCGTLLLTGCNSGGSSSSVPDNPDDGGADNGEIRDDGNMGSGEIQTAWVHPLPQGHSLNSVLEHNGRLFAAGDNGTILSSDDGTEWTVSQAGTQDFRDLTSNGHILVAVGGVSSLFDNDAWSYYSDDEGDSWHRAVLPDNTRALYAVTWTGNQFIALGQETEAHFTSTDGKNWNRVESGPSRVTNTIASDGNSRLVVGHNNGFYLSEDGGSTWTMTATYDGTTGNAITDIHFNGGEFAASAQSNQWGFRVSSNGSSWSREDDDFDYLWNSSAGSFTAIAYGDNAYWLTGNNGSVHKRQADEPAWDEVFSGANVGTLNAIAYTSRGYYAVGENGVLLSSSNGTDWVVDGQNMLDIDQWKRVAQSDSGRMVALTEDGRVYYSDSIQEWHEAVLDDAPELVDLSWTGSYFVATGTDTVAYSADGSHWTVMDPRPLELQDRTIPFTHIAGNGDQWLAMVGGAAANDDMAICELSACTIRKGQTATNPPLGWRNVVATTEGYLVIRTNGWAYFSENGQDWESQERALNTTNMFNVHLSAMGDVVVAATYGNSHLYTAYSSDGGTTWHAVSFPDEASVSADALLNDGERFFMKDDSAAALWISDNGQDWVRYSMSHSLSGLAKDGSSLYIMGDANHIIEASF